MYPKNFVHPKKNFVYTLTTTGLDDNVDEKSKASIHTNDKVYFKNSEVTLPNNETDSNTKGKFS